MLVTTKNWKGRLLNAILHKCCWFLVPDLRLFVCFLSWFGQTCICGCKFSKTWIHPYFQTKPWKLLSLFNSIRISILIHQHDSHFSLEPLLDIWGNQLPQCVPGLFWFQHWSSYVPGNTSVLNNPIWFGTLLLALGLAFRSASLKCLEEDRKGNCYKNSWKNVNLHQKFPATFYSRGGLQKNNAVVCLIY